MGGIRNFVCDCGTFSKEEYLNYAIKIFKHNFLIGELDLLILSHLHYDHVSGLNELISNNKINTVVLSYLAPIERLIICTKFSKFYDKKWYYDFLVNPVNYLLEKGIKRIILVGPEPGSKPESLLENFINTKELDIVDFLPDNIELQNKYKNYDRNQLT